MNPQPSHETINFFSILFVFLILYFMYKNRNNISTNNYDMFELFYEINNSAKTPVNIINNKNKDQRKNLINNTKNTRKLKSHVENIAQKKEVVTSNCNPSKVNIKNLKQKDFKELHNDCVNALVSLGMKKRESINTVIDIFNKNDINSIEEFIKKAFVPNEYYRSSS